MAETLNTTASVPNNQTVQAKPAAKPSQSKTQLIKRQPIKDGETRKRTLDVSSDNKSVRATYTFKTSKDATHDYPVESVFDFSNCTQAEILQLASASVRITIQGKLRAMGDKALDATAYATVDVKSEVVETQRTQLDETVKTIRQLARGTGMTEADARKFVEAQLAKGVKK